MMKKSMLAVALLMVGGAAFAGDADTCSNWMLTQRHGKTCSMWCEILWIPIAKRNMLKHQLITHGMVNTQVLH